MSRFILRNNGHPTFFRSRFLKHHILEIPIGPQNGVSANDASAKRDNRGGALTSSVRPPGDRRYIWSWIGDSGSKPHRYTQGTTTTTTTVYIFYTYYNIYSISILSLLSLSYRTASNPNHKTTTVVIVQQYNNMILSDVSLQYVRLQYCMIMTMRKPRTCSCSLAPCCLLYLRGHPWPLAFARGAVALFPLR